MLNAEHSRQSIIAFIISNHLRIDPSARFVLRQVTRDRVILFMKGSSQPSLPEWGGLRLDVLSSILVEFSKKTSGWHDTHDGRF